MLFGVYLVRQKIISPETFVEALERIERSRPALGELALSTGRLTMKQVFQVLGTQSKNGEPFGRIAVRLGYLTKQDLAELLLMQTDHATPLRQVLLDMHAADETTLDSAQQRFYDEASNLSVAGAM